MEQDQIFAPQFGQNRSPESDGRILPQNTQNLAAFGISGCKTGACARSKGAGEDARAGRESGSSLGIQFGRACGPCDRVEPGEAPVVTGAPERLLEPRGAGVTPWRAMPTGDAAGLEEMAERNAFTAAV